MEEHGRERARTLAGKTAVITGASSGIGEAAALEFARLGASVVLAARDADKLAALEGAISSFGGRALAVKADVTRPQDARNLLEAAAGRFGAPDVLVNNAGLGLSGRVAELRPEDLRHVFEVNVLGVVNCVQAALPLVGEGARIVNVSSVVGKRSIPMVGGYCASKFALNALTDALRVEVAARGIRVTNVYPGTTSTTFSKNSLRTGSEERGWRPSGVPPSKVAEKIARAAAAEKPPRDVYVSARDRLFVAATVLLPGLTDRVLARWAKD